MPENHSAEGCIVVDFYCLFQPLLCKCCRYVADFRLAMKARGPCKQWWENTLRPLRSAEMEATNSYMASLTAAEPPKASQPEHKPSAHTTTHKAQNLRKPTGFKAKEVQISLAKFCGQ